MQRLKSLRRIFLALMFLGSGPLVRAQSFDKFLSAPVFSSLDGRAIYGKGIFPEPLLAPEMDVEREVRLDWLHSEKRGTVSDEATAEVEWSFGLLTVEAEFKYQRDSMVDVDPFTGAR